jgi:hypothetical protein
MCRAFVWSREFGKCSVRAASGNAACAAATWQVIASGKEMLPFGHTSTLSRLRTDFDFGNAITQNRNRSSTLDRS